MFFFNLWEISSACDAQIKIITGLLYDLFGHIISTFEKTAWPTWLILKIFSYSTKIV